MTSSLMRWLEENEPLSNWVMAFLTFLAILVALFGGFFTKWIDKPKIELSMENPLRRSGGIILGDRRLTLCDNDKCSLISRGQIVRVKISNIEGEMVRKVIVRLTRILDKNESQEYHPSQLRWSGEAGYGPVDIYARSYHYLDLLKLFDSSYIEIKDEKGRRKINDAERKELEKQNLFPDSLVWETSINHPEQQGLPRYFKYSGEYEIYFEVVAENLKPVKYLCVLKCDQHIDKPLIELKRIN